MIGLKFVYCFWSLEIFFIVSLCRRLGWIGGNVFMLFVFLGVVYIGCFFVIFVVRIYGIEFWFL